MLSDRVSNPGPLTYESGALLIALRGPMSRKLKWLSMDNLSSPPFALVTYRHVEN